MKKLNVVKVAGGATFASIGYLGKTIVIHIYSSPFL
jgi:hypothetical protein